MPDKTYNKCVINGTTYLDLSQDTVTADKLLQGYTAHDKNGVQITGTATSSSIVISDTTDSHGGTIRTITAEDAVYLQEKSVTPSSSQQVITPDTGYNGFSKVTVNGDSDLVSSNIVNGVQIFGVTGNVVLQNYYTGSSAPSSSTGSNGDLYLQT